MIGWWRIEDGSLTLRLRLTSNRLNQICFSIREAEGQGGEGEKGSAFLSVSGK